LLLIELVWAGISVSAYISWTHSISSLLVFIGFGDVPNSVYKGRSIERIWAMTV
jgi:hypothetical protein